MKEKTKVLVIANNADIVGQFFQNLLNLRVDLFDENKMYDCDSKEYDLIYVEFGYERYKIIQKLLLVININNTPILCEKGKYSEKEILKILMEHYPNSLNYNVLPNNLTLEELSSFMTKYSNCKIIEKTKTKYTVLIVEDNFYERVLLKKIMEKYFNISIIFVSNGLDAVEYLRKNKIHLVITDINMPLMNGYQLLVFIRNTLQLKELKIIVASGYAKKGIREDALNKGADYYISKPYDPFDFRMVVNYYLLMIENNNINEKVT
ncbi:MAG: response regulator [bacterium]